MEKQKDAMLEKSGESASLVIRQKTVAEQLVKEIRSMIANGTYKTNDQIPTEQELAKLFNVSRTSVREAIKTLNYLGILESHTSRGTRITNKNRIVEEATAWSVILGYDDMRDVFALGTAIDTQVVIIAIETLKHDHAAYTDFSDRILEILQALTKAAVEQNLADFRSQFSEFFRTFYSISENTVFLSLNECIDSLTVEKVCTAYHATGTMLEVADFFASAWDAIQNYNMLEGIDIFQKYGAFAYDIVTRYEEYVSGSDEKTSTNL